ncbi:response regulator transcription factor [Spirulina sp. CS-785/01]|uniref:response regulator n=1 Tax=Spirulina sp. CS-785/01 TaxID=3021716 RepID=UPI00232F17D1|nr:response regulator transcription factor [Spirulina sp. CS-785/01]MDB9314580.1 response regulator transcription factor [Spirulina sp. CS-785/01]
MPISTLLVDDEQKFRQGLRTLLEFYNQNGSLEFDIVGEAASVDQAVTLARQQHPRLILLDLELPPDNGINALLRLRELPNLGKVLVLSAHHDDDWIFRAMQAGAVGYVFKDSLANQLHEAIATVLNNQIYLAAEVATHFFRHFQFLAGRSLPIAQSLNLTEREQEVLHWLVQGDSNEAIAEHLYITVATVKAHLTSIFEKLGVNSRTQAIVKALKLGLVRA